MNFTVSEIIRLRQLLGLKIYGISESKQLENAKRDRAQYVDEILKGYASYGENIPEYVRERISREQKVNVPTVTPPKNRTA